MSNNTDSEQPKSRARQSVHTDIPQPCNATGVKVKTYLGVVIICSVLSIVFHLYHAHQNEARQQLILEKYEQSLNAYREALPPNRARQLEIIVECNQNHQEEIKTLLELEFNKIQNEYETQEIWTAILTIVFLIFSFYSLFKSEELERQGHESLRSIRDVEKRAKSAYDKIEREKSKKINSIQAQYKEWITSRKAEISKEIREKTEDLENTIQASNKKAQDDLSANFSRISNQFKDVLTNEYEQFIAQLDEKHAKDIETFFLDLQSKNASEIQKQVALWEARFSKLKEDYERQFNQMLEELNPAQSEDIAEQIEADEPEIAAVPVKEAPIKKEEEEDEEKKPNEE